MAGNSNTEAIKANTEELRRPREPVRKTARVRTRVPDHEIAEIRDVGFPVAMRGYDRAAVDDYVSRVNRLLAELQITAAPESAIRHALDQVADETRGILERAHETADEITRRSRAQAEDRLQLAEREAEDVRAAADAYAREIRAAAETHLRALQTDVDRVWQEREGILTSLHELTGQVEQIAAQAAERYPSRPDVDPRTAVVAPEPAKPAPPTTDDEDDEPHPFADD
jgi:DivIVA domain-containing protein